MINALHQTTASCDMLDELERTSSILMRKLHPNATYHLWDDSHLYELGIRHFPALNSIWEQLRGIQKSDIGRYVVLYVHGGFYVDMDVIPLKSLDLAISDASKVHIAPSTRIWPWTPADSTNYIIYTPRKRHPFFKQLVEEAIERIKRIKNPNTFWYVPKTTGRNLINDCIAHHDDIAQFDPRLIINKFCSCTKIGSQCVAYHEGSIARHERHMSLNPKTWQKNHIILITGLECRIRRLLGITGNISQAPIALIIIIVFLILISALIGWLG